MSSGCPALAAGIRLSKNEDAPEPGFYYEKDDGTWAYAGGDGKDTALVFYLFREALGRLDMVLSGFSGIGKTQNESNHESDRKE